MQNNYLNTINIFPLFALNEFQTAYLDVLLIFLLIFLITLIKFDQEIQIHLFLHTRLDAQFFLKNSGLI